MKTLLIALLVLLLASCGILTGCASSMYKFERTGPDGVTIKGEVRLRDKGLDEPYLSYDRKGENVEVTVGAGEIRYPNVEALEAFMDSPEFFEWMKIRDGGK